MLITMFLFERKILEKPLLFLSSYFRKHQNEYYDRLNSYHNGYVEEWIEFFLDAVIETAQEAIEMAKNIQKIRNTDIMKISALGKRESESGIKLLNFLFSCPIITAKNIVEVLGFSRAGAGKVIERFVNLQILMPYEASKKYGKRYVYQRYFETFL